MSKYNQRYKIYVNDKQLILIAEEELGSLLLDNQVLVLPYKGQQKSLFQYLDTLENSSRFSSIVLYAADVKDLFMDLKSLLDYIQAAGGVIENANNEILMIFRRGMWDLPKGKLDKEERYEDAAIRECTEEVGLRSLNLISKIGHSFHFYRDKKNLRCLKKTKWYHIKNEVEEIVIPQKEEDIEIAQWMNPKDALLLIPIHENIKHVLTEFLVLQNQIPAL
ncbi:MAG: NUDIX domain-containing protein [Saprospiraceae bacterium]